MKAAVPSMNNTLDGINGKLDLIKEKTSDLEDVAIEIIQIKLKENKDFKKKK